MANWFIALPLPVAAHWALPVDGLPVPLRGLAAADLHLTLAFLGACGEANARRAWRCANALRHPPIPIRPGGWRALGPSRAPSAFALVPAEGQELLAALIRRWRDPLLEAAAAPPDRRPPMPHITLARPPRRSSPAERAALFGALHEKPLPPEPALLGDLALFTWAQDRPQRLFRQVSSRPLPGCDAGNAAGP